MVRFTVIGITGTKGKGTVATMLYQILKRASREVFLVGNIGKPALDILPKLTKSSIIIFEFSSFQLQDLDRSPHIAVLFSPASASFDMFKNSKDRGTVFTKLVRGLARPRSLC